MRRHLSSILILAAVVALFATALVLGSHQGATEGSFGGTDNAATGHIEASQPGYTPWFKPLFEPGSGEVESGLFALQAALGGGLLGFVLGSFRERRRQRRADGTAALPDPSGPGA